MDPEKATDYIYRMRSGVVINSKEHPQTGILHYVQPTDKSRKDNGQKTIELSGCTSELEPGTPVLFLPVERTRKSMDRGIFVDRRRHGKVKEMNRRGYLVASDGADRQVRLRWCRQWVSVGSTVPYGVIKRLNNGYEYAGAFVDNTARGSVVAIGYAPSDMGVYFCMMGWGPNLERMKQLVQRTDILDSKNRANFFRPRAEFAQPKHGFAAWEGHHLRHGFLDDVLAKDDLLHRCCDPEDHIRRHNYCVDLAEIATDADRIAFNPELQRQFTRHTFEQALRPILEY